jgi:hypothetical protein
LRDAILKKCLFVFVQEIKQKIIVVDVEAAAVLFGAGVWGKLFMTFLFLKFKIGMNLMKMKWTLNEIFVSKVCLIIKINIDG